jgi:protein-S-isoprenylcysteine O-methyltransferase Ste14
MMHVDVKRLVVQITGLFLVLALALFLPAGTMTWLNGWIFLALFFTFAIAIHAWLFRHNPGLLRERTRWLGTSDQPRWDKMLYAGFEVLCLAWLILISLDAGRFHWSQVPVWLQLVGAIVLVCSFYLFFLTFRENSYLSPAVRIQAERAQTVVSTGPYHYVRHPMYSAIVIFGMGTPLLLGSWYGVLFGLILVAVIAWRAVLEERTLRQELPGYAAYMAQVKYRLIPYVW